MDFLSILLLYKNVPQMNFSISKPCHYIQYITLHQNLVCLAITNLKYKDYNNFHQFLLLLSGDLSPNLGPVQISPPVNVNIWEPFNKKRFAFSSYQYKQFTTKS